MTLTPDDLRLVRLLLREELERAEAHRKGQRPRGERRVRSMALAASLAPRHEPVDEVTRSRVRKALERRRTG